VKKTIFLLLITLLFPVSGFAGSIDTLNVMSFNIRFGELASLEQLGSYIESKHPDLVAIQECDWKLTRERAPQQSGKAYMNELAYYSGMFGLYGKAIDYKGGYYGVGLLSRYPIIKSERIYLPNPEPRKEQRVMLVAQIELPGPSVVTFVCTHLEVSSAEQRKAQIEFINQKIQEIKTPVILAGDFNAKPQDEEIREGFNTYCNATDTVWTFSTSKPSIKIDYIYGYPKNRFQLVSTMTDQDCKLSDHFPVQSKIIVLTNETHFKKNK
jgi:endonuclease/exonuclease/phosphatase family metal-dependent hydrolase